MRRSLKGRSKVASSAGRSALPVLRQGAVPGGLQWPLIGRRPAVPIEDWAPERQLGFAWGAEVGNWDIVVLVRGGGKVWASEYGGRGSGYRTDTAEPDWTDTQPISDGDYSWTEVASLTYVEWSAGMTIDGPTIVFKEGVAWISYPDYTGTTDVSEPDWAAALGSEPWYDADFVSDGDTYWWPFPPAVRTTTIDPNHPQLVFDEVLYGMDVLRMSTNLANLGSETDAFSTALDSFGRLRFESYDGTVFLLAQPEGDGGLAMQRGSDYGEGEEPQSANKISFLLNQRTGFRIWGDGGGGDGTARFWPRFHEQAKAFLMECDDVPLVFNGNPTDNVDPAFATSSWRVSIDEGANELVFTVVYANGTTVKTGTIPLT